MPLYDFECQSCGRLEEIMKTYDERDAPAACKSCAGALKRLLSAPMVRQGAGIHGQDASSKDWGELK